MKSGMDIKANHQVKVIRIGAVEKHKNADTLGIVRIGGYQAVVKTGEFQVGDLAYYVPPDSVVPERPEFAFLWTDAKTGVVSDSPVPVRRRRVKSRKFRGEWSEGLLMPLDEEIAVEGDDVAELIGITHYDPDEEREQVQRREQYHHWPRSLKGWFYFLLYKLGISVNGVTTGAGDNERGPKNPPAIYDVDALKNYPGVLEPGEFVRITEKIHGSNARFLYDGKKMYAGSRKLWKSVKSTSIWRRVLREHPEIEEWCRRNPGCTLYAEVGPTQKWKGGAAVDYGAAPGKTFYFAFDVLCPNEIWACPWDARLSLAPLLYEGAYSEEIARQLADGPSLAPGARHIREGVVIRTVPERYVHGLGRSQLKLVSNEFLEKS